MILVAIGSNVAAARDASPLETCRRAAAALDDVAGLRLVKLSRWYRSAPVPPSGQPSYINGMAALEGEVDPAALLAALQRVEQTFGRLRGEPNAARTLDLDIVAMGSLIRAAPDPVVPHPRMHLRAFVLMPLLDVTPDWWHPVLDKPAWALLDALPQPECHALPMPHLRDAANTPS